MDLQQSLPVQQRGRAVPAGGLHLTLIHFGKIRDVYEDISTVSGVGWKQYTAHLTRYIARTADLMPLRPVRLLPAGLARFGQRGGTLVVEYQLPAELAAVHSLMYQVLYTFLQDCGITGVDSFIAQNINFMHAPKLKPHITLYKGYAGPLPDIQLSPVTLAGMPVVYPPSG